MVVHETYKVGPARTAGWIAPAEVLIEEDGGTPRHRDRYRRGS
jgi:hypothetical protein